MDSSEIYSKSVIKRLAIQAPIPFEAGRQAGIREVVEHINNSSSEHSLWNEATWSNQLCLVCPKYLWQAFLKEKGIK